MELESLYDGVAGWSGAGSNMAPLIAPGDSFVAVFTPPRAGTFIYHTHMDETVQLGTGMYGPLIVVEPGARFDPATDIPVVIGGAVDNDTAAATIDGRRHPPARAFAAGTTYRLRFINILAADVLAVRLVNDSTPVTWTPVAKDGADVQPNVRRPVAATFRIGVGETYDFEWTPPRPMDAELLVETVESGVLRQTFRVR
jgi:FtsP/CotA-like multicopper oxidase with cupredoxin domain